MSLIRRHTPHDAYLHYLAQSLRHEGEGNEGRAAMYRRASDSWLRVVGIEMRRDLRATR